MPNLSNECETLVQRLKACDVEKILKNPTDMLSYYPVRDPDNPNTIFDEVYCLVNESLLSRSYRSRILYFLNTLLSSTKVPAYVIASYIKRLSRLTLIAKPKTLVTILTLIGNLFVRHPTLMFLRDQVDEKARELRLHSATCTLRDWKQEDPFNPDEMDLKNSRAMNSYIWELMPLRFHRHPRVAEAAAYLNQPTMLDMELDLDDLVK